MLATDSYRVRRRPTSSCADAIEYVISMESRLRSFAVKVFGSRAIRAAAFALAVARQRSLILVYHRVLPDEEARKVGQNPIVPCVSTSLLRQHIEFLQDVGEIVPLEELQRPAVLGAAGRGRVRFCVSFDDDEVSHVRHALPIVEELHVPVTFFLSGRSLHGLGPPWWIVLESEIERVGLENVSAVLGVRANSSAELAALIEGTPAASLIEARFSQHVRVVQLSADDIARLAESPQSTTGFHTLGHQVLTSLSDVDVTHVLVHGRAALEGLSGVPIRCIAYPHGKADSRIAALARTAGYTIGCQGLGRPVSAMSDPLRLARWEPGPMPIDELAANLALRLCLVAAAQ